MSFVDKIDYIIAKIFHNIYMWGGNATNTIMEGISFLAEAGILFLLVGLCLALFKQTRKIGVTVLLAVAFGFLFTNIILKPIINRARPFENISGDFYKWWLDAGANFESGHSFPSGHTTATTAFAMAIFLTTKKKYSGYVLLLPLLMASSRIYLMVHYFSDCFAGIVVGTVSAVIACLLMKWIYCSKFKLFVWARELELFKSKQKDTPTHINTLESPKEEYVYTTQEDENKNLTQNENHTSSDDD